MHKIAFHSNQLSIRGTEVALYDYAYYFEKILKGKAYIISDKGKDLATLEKFENQFEVFLYESFDEVAGYLHKNGIKHIYYHKAGFADGKIVPEVSNLVHVVFKVNEPHGQYYTFISKWLARTVTNSESNYVPYIVRLPEVTEDYRDVLNIPKDAIVIGRHGGFDQFDITFAQEAVYEIVRSYPNIYFVFLNTKQFCEEHPNIIHLEPTWDLEKKTGYINTCDAMLHARSGGESFGLAVAEFLHQDKPVISCPLPLTDTDANHIEMLGDLGKWYTSKEECIQQILSIEHKDHKGVYRELVKQFTPENVMERFKNTFNI
jgi:hypothetical protein